MKILVCGCGRIGSPLLTYLAYQNVLIPGCFTTVAGVDVDASIINQPVSARFKEVGWQELLQKLDKNNVPRPIIFSYENAEKVLGPQDTIIITCGTPLDKNLNPDTSQLTSAVDSLIKHNLLVSSTLIILRSTMFPGGTRWLSGYIKEKYSLEPRIAMAPERIAEGYTFQEISKIPQIIGADDDAVLYDAHDFFKKKFGSIQAVPLGPLVGGTVAAEIAKLMCNTWRYVGFATANEFAMLCDEVDADFDAVRYACNYDYWRCYIPKAALNVGGPCLGKDAQILSAYSRNAEITLAAYNTAEKTATYYINKYKKKIKNGKIGILGLAFKANSDNPTNSLSYKVIKHLEIIGPKEICVHDPIITHKYSKSLNEVLDCSVIFIMTEHDIYSDIEFKPSTLVIRP